MPLALIFIALILLVAAYQNTVGDLFTNVATDAAGFAKWFAALALVAGLQWVPGLERVGKWLAALVLLVLVLRNYTKIFAGLQNIASTAGSGTASVTSPAQAYVANPSSPGITSGQITGTSSGSTSGSSSNVASLVSQFENSLPKSFGFGGTA